MDACNKDAHRVIITADDYGAMRCIDRGILEAVKAGSVSCVSVMSNFDRFDMAMDDLDTVLFQNNESVGIGLHLNLTAGASITRNNGLTTTNGCFLNANTLLKKIDNLRLDQVEAEIEEQLNRLRTRVKKVDHISHHMNIMCLHPKFFELLIKIAKQHNLPVRNPHSMSFDQSVKLGLPPIKRAIAKRLLSSVSTIIQKPSLLPTLVNMSDTKQLLGKLESEGIKTTSRFCDLFYGQPSFEILKNTFSHFKKNEHTEIMTRPGYFEHTEMIPNGIDPSYLAKRQRELSTLLHQNFHSLFDKNMVLTAGFSVL